MIFAISWLPIKGAYYKTCMIYMETTVPLLGRWTALRGITFKYGVSEKGDIYKFSKYLRFLSDSKFQWKNTGSHISWSLHAWMLRHLGDLEILVSCMFFVADTKIKNIRVSCREMNQKFLADFTLVFRRNWIEKYL